MANEKRLISYDVLIAHLDSCIEQGKGLFKSVCVAIKCFVEQMPTVDAVEVVHGQWLFVTKGQQTSVYVCSECNRAVTVVCDEDKIKEQLAKNYPYCHCGAKMDGDGND